MRGTNYSGAIALLTALVTVAASGCTISARTGPAEGPRLKKDEVKKAVKKDKEKSSRPDPDEGFVVPQAEWLSDSADSGSHPASSAQNTDPGFVLGSAHVQLGPRPPFAEPPTLPGLSDNADASAARAAIVPTQWRLLKTIRVGEGYLYQAEFTPDQKSVLTLSTDSGTLYHYELATGRLIQEIKLENAERFEDISFAVIQEFKERTQVLVTRKTGTFLLDLESGNLDELTRVPPGTDVAHSGRFGLYGVSLRQIDPQSGSLTLEWITQGIAATLTCDRRPDGWVLSSDGTKLALSYYPGEEVQLLDLKNRELLMTAPLPKWGSSIALSPDGSLMAMGGELLRIIRVPSGEVVFEDKKYGNNIGNVRFTSDGGVLLTAAFDGKARSYVLPKELTEKSPPRAPQMLVHGGTANVYGLGLSADERMLVTSSGDKTLKIWVR